VANGHAAATLDRAPEALKPETELLDERLPDLDPDPDPERDPHSGAADPDETALPVLSLRDRFSPEQPDKKVASVATTTVTSLMTLELRLTCRNIRPL
jgi:hypothetical protein